MLCLFRSLKWILFPLKVIIYWRFNLNSFKKTEKGHREILINFENNKLRYVVSPVATMGSRIILNVKFITFILKWITFYISIYIKLYPEHEKFDHVEISSEAARYIELISQRLSEFNGSLLLIDYGHNGTPKDTLRVILE